MRYELNHREVSSERLDGEVIAIHLVSANYYSFRGSGDFVWVCVLAGWTAEEISDYLAQTCDQAREGIAGHVSDFVAYLLQEGLIVPRQGGEREEVGDLVQINRFLPPEFQKFTDMQELLLVDPIHEVTEAGWPERVPSGK